MEPRGVRRFRSPFGFSRRGPGRGPAAERSRRASDRRVGAEEPPARFAPSRRERRRASAAAAGTGGVAELREGAPRGARRRRRRRAAEAPRVRGPRRRARGRSMIDAAVGQAETLRERARGAEPRGARPRPRPLPRPSPRPEPRPRSSASVRRRGARSRSGRVGCLDDGALGARVAAPGASPRTAPGLRQAQIDVVLDEHLVHVLAAHRTLREVRVVARRGQERRHRACDRDERERSASAARAARKRRRAKTSARRERRRVQTRRRGRGRGCRNLDGFKSRLIASSKGKRRRGRGFIPRVEDRRNERRRPFEGGF